MKCPNCGSNLTIDDEVCSFCGVANPHARTHREEMRRFKKDYDRTKSEVMEKTQSHSRIAAKIVLIAVMVVLDLIMILTAADSYELRKFIINNRAQKNYAVHKAELDRLEAERDYIGLAVYFEKYSLTYSDLFDEFGSVYNMANNYERSYTYIMRLVTDDGKDSYFNPEQTVEALAQLLEYMYTYSKPREYCDMTEYTEQHQACMDDIIGQTEDLLQTYLNIPAEKMDEFWEMSKARKQIMMEEGLRINE